MFYIGLLSSLLMGLTLGLVGSGGSILTVPILLYLFNFDAVMATTSSLFVVGTVALVGAFFAARKGEVNLKTGSIFAFPSFFGVYLVRSFLLPRIPFEIIIGSQLAITKSQIILLSFSILMIFASLAMIRSKPTVDVNRGAPNILRVMINGFFIGGITGFVGAGGGFLIIPTLVFILKLPMRKAVGTSLAIIAANSLFGFAISIKSSAVNWPIILAVTTLGVMGIGIGGTISRYFPETHLRRIFGFLVLGLGIFMILDRTF